MMKMEFEGQQFEILRGSDVQRDGMYLEASAADGEAVAEIFFSDQTGTLSVSLFRQDLPLSLVEWLSSSARRALVPGEAAALGELDVTTPNRVTDRESFLKYVEILRDRL